MNEYLTRAARVVYNAAIDLRFGRPLTGAVATRFAHLGAKNTANSDYLALDPIFAGRIEPDDVLVDVGCGKGRVINYWLRHYDNPIIGIELDPWIAADTRRRLRRFRNVAIIAGDAVDCLPREGTLFYLYNPFSAEVMQQFANRLAAIGTETGGQICVLYNNCKYLAPFADNPDDWSVDLLDASVTEPFDPVAVIGYVGGPP